MRKESETGVNLVYCQVVNEYRKSTSHKMSQLKFVLKSLDQQRYFTAS